MATIEELVNVQNNNGSAIQRLITNVRKAPLDRRTSEFYEEKLRELDNLWSIFNEKDQVIRRSFGQNIDHPYFVKDYYAVIGGIFNEARTEFQGKLDNQKPVPSTSPGEVPIPTAEPIIINKTDLTSKIRKQAVMIKVIEDLVSKLSLAESTQSERYQVIQLKAIEQHWVTAVNLHKEIWKSIETIDSNVYDFESYFDLESRINMLLSKHEIQQEQPAPHAVGRNIEIEQVKLPRIEIPKFNGDYSTWRQFRDLFIEIIDKQNIPTCQKLWYLKTSVTGEAAGLIQHFAITAANYQAAWQTIVDRYENIRMLINAVFRRLLANNQEVSDTAESMKAFHDTIQECLLSLKGLSIITSNWDSLLLYLLAQRLNTKSHTLWEQSLKDPKQLPTLEEFLKFLKLRFQSLEAISKTFKYEVTKNQTPSNHKKGGIYKALNATLTSNARCIICKGEHSLYKCESFIKLTPNQRLDAVQRAKLCVNCLKDGHKAKQCSSGYCRKCKAKHNTMLHLESTVSNNENSSGQSPTMPSTSSASLASAEEKWSGVLLSTVRIIAKDKYGNDIQCRALLDNGSQTNFITTKLAKKLGLQQTNGQINIEGIGRSRAEVNSRVNLCIKSTCTEFTTNIEAYVLPHIVSNQPAYTINKTQWKLPKNLTLADPKFNESSCVDILIGSGLFYPILSIGQISLGKGMPTLQNSLFGWLIGGKFVQNQGNTQPVTCGVGIEEMQLNQNLERFWKMEESTLDKSGFTSTEKKVEQDFIQTIQRNEQGRFVVKLPFIGNPNQLGDSSEIARQRFNAVERKLSKNPDIKQQYIAFMREYEKLGHMSKISTTDIQSPHFFLPHHAVFKPDSTTTKCRIVFDASAKTSTNVSLNDILATGPVIQDDLFNILLRFRQYKYVFTADVEKMYRQILMNQEDRPYQLIWWREDPMKPLECYALNTVTYGTTSAPYLAIKTLRTLADIGYNNTPLASQAIKTNFYVDDVLTGSDELSVARDIQSQLQQLLGSAGFKLRKWSANHAKLLEAIPLEDREELTVFQDEGSYGIKTMGLIWNPNTDMFNIKVEPCQHTRVTKRTALSDISQLFDPLGFIAPVTATAKIFLQELWKLKLDWDAALPQELHHKWVTFREELQDLKLLNIPRHLFGGLAPQDIQIHVFADASERAFGAVAYMRISTKRNIIVRFICAKSRVAPVKQCTLPRLELCAAVLAVEMRQQLQESLSVKIDQFFMWTDSTITLSWIKSEASHYHTFVANRISNIQRLSSPGEWRHVRSADNPADLVSRGLWPSQMKNNSFWFFGPQFLHGAITGWPLQPPLSSEGDLEKRAKQILATASPATTQPNLWTIIQHNNSFRRLQRIVAFALRFKNPKAVRESTTPTATELDNSLITIIRHVQEESFLEDIKLLRKTRGVASNSTLVSLNPFIDKNGILRVGGRLENANISYDAKHPMVLPSSHSFTKMLFNDICKENLHTGAQSLLAIVRQRFWPIRGKDIARSVIKACVHCTRMRPQLCQQLMGNLPADRVQPARPFINTGVDFFGPVWTHYKIRGKRPSKAYVAVFCCLYPSHVVNKGIFTLCRSL